MAFCKNCGVQIPDNSAFCGNCGASQTQVVNGYTGGTVVMVKPKVPGRGFGISSMVLGIIGLVYGAILMLGMGVLDSVDFGYISSSVYASSLGSVFGYSVLSILSVCFAPAAFKRGYKNGVSNSGLVMGVIGLICYFITALIILSNI